MKRLIAISILLLFTSLEVVDSALIMLESEQGMELVESETDNSEKESETENQEKNINEKLVSGHIAEFNHSLVTQKHELDRGLLLREIYEEVISPPPELS